jgi:hypothetical protein
VVQHIIHKRNVLHLRIHSIIPELIEWIDRPFNHMFELSELITKAIEDMQIKINLERKLPQVEYIKPFLHDRIFLQETLKTWTDPP